MLEVGGVALVGRVEGKSGRGEDTGEEDRCQHQEGMRNSDWYEFSGSFIPKMTGRRMAIVKWLVGGHIAWRV
jgi:hypothetical protein